MTRKQLSLVGALFILAFLLGAVMNTPVVQLFHFIKLPKQVMYQGLQGSVTKGKVDKVFIQGVTISNLEYHFQPSCLLKLAVCYQLSSDEDGILLNLQLSPITQSTQVSDSYIDLPNTVFDNIPNLLFKPAGDFRIEVGQLGLDSNQRLTDINALLIWNNAGIQGEKQVIGNYAAEITNSKDGINALISDQNSLLGLKGNVSLSWKGSYAIDLELEHKPGLNASLISFLDVSAKKSGLNLYRMKQNGILPANILQIFGRFSPDSNK
jgi:hypothetical protein